MTDESRSWTNHAGGYFVCSHMGCTKKVNPTITDHECCGRCGRGGACLSFALNNYNGPGSFAHTYFEVFLRPGVCDTCGESPDVH